MVVFGDFWVQVSIPFVFVSLLFPRHLYIQITPSYPYIPPFIDTSPSVPILSSNLWIVNLIPLDLSASQNRLHRPSSHRTLDFDSFGLCPTQTQNTQPNLGIEYNADFDFC